MENGTGTGQSSPANISNGAEQKPVNSTLASPDQGGSSSPLVPVLIAIAILAAFSIAVVVVRQRRRRGSDGQFSPKAS